MDHLPLPNHPRRSLPIVPCLTRQNYDGGDLQNYPERCGWRSRSRKDWYSLFKAPPSDFLAFMQTWRFFAIPAILFSLDNGTPPGIADLTRSVGGKDVIDTSRLPDMTEKFIRENDLIEIKHPKDLESRSLGLLELLSTLRNQIQQHRFSNTATFSRTILVIMASFSIEKGIRKQRAAECECSIDPSRVESLSTFISNCRVNDPLPISIQDSIDVLLGTINSMLLSKFRLPNPSRMNPSLQEIFGSDVNRLVGQVTFGLSPDSSIISDMTNDGWCPSLTSHLRQRFEISAMIFLSNLEKPDSLNHRTCTEERCNFEKVDEKRYHRKHAPQCNSGNCPDVLAEARQMHSILQDDHFPIINATLNGSQASINLSSSGRTKNYVAISHVWSDGLGNPKQNAIPVCQLKALHQMVSNLPIPTPAGSPAPFWLDTICCPVEENDDQIAAIGLMRDTYEKASVVLVLDSSTLSMNMRDMNGDVEICMRILRSRWTTRLWTLQEGALARKLFFQFADGPYDVMEGIKRCQQKDTEDAIAPEILREYLELRVFRIPTMTIEQKLVAVSKALRFRSTSVDVDEPLCLSTLLGLDTRKVMAMSPDKRFQHFWESLVGIPSSILFHDAPRSSRRPHEWAPQSFLKSGTGAPNLSTALSKVDVSTKQAISTSKGLLLEVPIMATAFQWTLPVGDRFYLYALSGNDLDGVWYLITTSMDNERSTQRYSQPSGICSHSSERLRVRPQSTNSSDRLFIALSRISSGISRDSVDGLLMVGSSTRQEVSARPICRVDARRLDRADDRAHLQVLDGQRSQHWKSVDDLHKVASNSDTGNLFFCAGVKPILRQLCIG